MKNLSFSFIGVEFDDQLETTPPVTPVEEKKEEVKFEKQDEKNVSAVGETATVPVELLSSLIELAKKNSGGGVKESEEKLEKILGKLTSAIRDNSDIETRFLGARPIPYEEVDKEDILEVPAYFFAHSVSKTIMDDYRQGTAIQIPYGRPIKFKTISRVLTQSNARNPSFLTVSACVIYSKKVAEWMRRHTEFKITFFEKVSDGKDITAAMAEKLSVAFNMVSQMSEHEVASACARENIAIDTQDFAELRRRLATNRAKRMLQSEAESRNRSVKDLQNFFEGKVEVVAEAAPQRGPLIQPASMAETVTTKSY